MNGNPWLFSRPQWVTSRVSTGAPQITSRIPWFGGDQRFVPSASAFLSHAPSNFCWSDGADVAGLDVLRFYTVPAYAADMVIDKNTHNAFLAAHGRGDIMGALRNL